ncbi:MAG: GHKL domain-containing protein [Saprospiraceae bacterium]|nr:GHKL domain-containing protein [Saprospiraceae bacterium]
MAITYFMIFDFLPSNKYSLALCINLGLLSVPICYSLMLAGDYARISRSLVSKLIEVETLSAEKQQLLAIQNETLEKQVKERTAELNQSLIELKSTQTQLIQSEKLASLGELTAGIAHEIQNPLNFVNNFSEISVELAQELGEEVKKSDLDKDVVHGLVGDLSQNQIKINHHGKRAASIVTGMLQHARAGTGKKEPADLNALADEYLRLAYHGLRAKDPNFNTKMITDFDPAIGKVDVIPQDMGRVLLNLINNAFYAVHQRELQLSGSYVPTVTVSTQQTDNQIIIKIKDNGTGIPDSVKAKMFQPFFTTKPTGQGTGLGLSLAYDIVVKGHGGTLEVESAEGVGTTFIIQLPNQQQII